MKNITISLFLLVSLVLSSCSALTNLGVKVITPSKVVISENRNVSGFTAIEFSTVGKVNIIQGSPESLNITGPDNLVPEITTTVNGNTLTIKNKENITIGTFNSDNMLTFTIVASDLTSLSVSGAGDVQVESFSPASMDLNMSGAGNVVVNQLSTGTLKVNLSGLGGLDISGQATNATIDISGAGNVTATDLKLNTVNVSISGVGGARLWVADRLTGNISGAGSVSYYGSPQTSFNTSGIGNFKSLGNK